MKKNANRRPRPRLQTLEAAQLASVNGGGIFCAAMYHSPGDGWYEFYYAAAKSSGQIP